MPAATVRISEAAHRALQELAERERVSMQTVLDRAIENYRRNRFLDAVNQTFAALRGDDEKWKAEADERREWSATNTDGDTDEE
jgi:predicted transcriptional regulator